MVDGDCLGRLDDSGEIALESTTTMGSHEKLSVDTFLSTTDKETQALNANRRENKILGGSNQSQERGDFFKENMPKENQPSQSENQHVVTSIPDTSFLSQDKKLVGKSDEN